MKLILMGKQDKHMLTIKAKPPTSGAQSDLDGKVNQDDQPTNNQSLTD